VAAPRRNSKIKRDRRGAALFGALLWLCKRVPFEARDRECVLGLCGSTVSSRVRLASEQAGCAWTAAVRRPRCLPSTSSPLLLFPRLTRDPAHKTHTSSQFAHSLRHRFAQGPGSHSAPPSEKKSSKPLARARATIGTHTSTTNSLFLCARADPSTPPPLANPTRQPIGS